MNPVLDHVPRSERRRLLNAEARARRGGNWGPWQIVAASPIGRPGGWLAQVDRCHRNRVFAVLVRNVAGGVIHFAVGSLSGQRPTWHEMQRIKDELAGPETTAVEVYPPHDEVVDGADMFHLWVLPGPLPFGLATCGPADQCPTCGRHFPNGGTCPMGGCPMGGDF